MPLANPGSLPCDGLSVLNGRPKILPGPCLLHQLIRPASNDGQSDAIDFLSKDGLHTTLSYPELHAVSHALAFTISSSLRSAQASSTSESRPEGPLIIPILSPQSPQLYVAILAILEAGGAFCPLDPEAPPDRVGFILEDVGAKIVLASRELACKLPLNGHNYQVIFINDVLDIPTIDDPVANDNGLKPEDLAYVMYTSGSTGTPKGVAISHLAATQSILAHERHIPPFSRFLQFAAPIFDVSVFEIFFPLFRGATLVGCDRAALLNDLVGALKKLEVDACELTPSVAGSLLRRRARAPDLRLLLTIGELLTEPVVREFGGDESKTSMLWGMYGPTEATIHCTLQAAFETFSPRSKIGIPLDTVSAFVIRIQTDRRAAPQFELLPLGDTGELALGGLQLATFYINKPDRTATSFMDTPWGRVYRTGDKAKIRPDGTIEYLGRINESQVKLNGQRVELGEVEQALLRTPGCHGAAAAVISSTLVAFASVEDLSNSNAQLWDQCRSWLPAFMMPKDIVIMEHLPQMPSGKIDRKRLVNDYVTNTAQVTSKEETVDEREHFLCKVASAILGERVGPQTRFTAARMDSLAAIEYASALREIGVSVTPVDILSAQTPRELRRRIDDGAITFLAPIPGPEYQSEHRQPADDGQVKMSLKRVFGERIREIDRIEPPTSLQLAMITETLKGAHLYINQVELELTSHVTVDVLRSSLISLAECNEILRTGFTFVENQLQQVIWKRLDDCQLHNLTDGNPHPGNGEDVELFLLHPLKIEIRHPTPEAEHFRLLLTLHHAIYDGWTIDLMIEDLSVLLNGEEPAKRPQFSQIMRNFRESTEASNVVSMEFWTEHLRGVGAAATSDFRTVAISRPRRAVTTAKLSLHPKALEDLMMKVSVGPQVLFQACLVWLWAAVQGTEDTVIGSVSSGRNLPFAGIDKLMGPCMKTLPLRVNVSKYRTIIELLQSIHLTNRETLRHDHIPLSRIQQAVGLSAGSKLFDVIFAYQESPSSRRRKLSIIRETWHCDATEANLVVEIQPCGDHFVCTTTFQTDILPQPLVEAFVDHLNRLVSYFSSHVGARIQSIPRCFPFDSLSHFNDSPAFIKTCSNLPEMVERSASQFLSTPALCFATSIGPSAVNPQSYSYRDINLKANQIAHHLQECGITARGIIAIIMEKSPLLYASILGILKTGCAYLPILPGTPVDRVNFILDQAEPCLSVVDTSSSLAILDRVSPTIVNIEKVALSSYSNANLGIRSSPSDLAYVIYTSGTTGTPKGVAVTNKNILSNIEVLSGIYPHDPTDRMLQACSQAFDVSVFEIFFSWANGMCLCAATNDTLFEDFEQAVRSLKITHLSLTVTVASLLNPDNVPTVKFLVTSGEPMTDNVLDSWSQHLYQGYGPSETTNICTVRKVSRRDSSHFLGYSLENTSAFVLHPSSTHLVPVGCIGELCFGGDQIASGYLKLPDTTASQFIDHPIYGRLYRSGDLGRMFPDGSLTIHGRADTQVKLRGLRIELQEIQAIVLNTGAAQACKIILFTNEDGKSQHLVLFYVPRGYGATGFQVLPLTGDSRALAQTLRHALQSRLPDYMVPEFILPISALPLTSSGKIDEGALRSSIGELSADTLSVYNLIGSQTDLYSDWSETEKLVADVIAGLYGKDIQMINRWATFSALGIDSISAMPVARKLQTILRKRVPLSLLLRNPSINRLAAALNNLEHSGHVMGSCGLLLPEELVETMKKRYTREGQSVAKVLPCTPLQEAMVMASLSPSPGAADNGLAYYNQMLFHLRVPYKEIMNLWDAVVKRHEILRALFVTSDNIKYPVIQIILRSFTPKWDVFEAEYISLYDRASRHVVSVSATADFSRPPMALAIFRTGKSGDYLSFVCHHAMYDGIAMRILLSEIEALYHGRQLLEPPSLEPFIRESQSSYRNNDGFWKHLFLGFQPVPLKCHNFTKDDMSRTICEDDIGMSLSFIESQLHDTGISMLALIQTTWAITLAALSGSSDISFGSVIAGRSIPLDMVDNLVAPCFNTLPVRMDLSLSTFLIDIMKGFQGLHAEMMPYQFASLRHIQKEITSANPLFDTLVILQPPATPLDDTVWSLEYEDGFMDIPIACEIIPSRVQDTLMIQLHRDKSKFSYQALKLVGHVFTHVLIASLRYPSSHVLKGEQLPDNLQKDITRLFRRPEYDQPPTNFSYRVSNNDETWSSSELAVRQILAKFTGVPEDQIERFTPIYRYGLDSITAIQLAALLRQQGLFIPAIDVLGHPTCAGIAAAVRESPQKDLFGAYDFESFRKQVETGVRASEINIDLIEEILPCTATQQGMLSQFEGSNGRCYFNYSCWALDIATNPENTAQAWSQLAKHHEILRSGFVPVDHPGSSFAMLVYCMNGFEIPVEIYRSDTFDAEQWFSDTMVGVLGSLARPPWRVALESPNTVDGAASVIIHLAMHHALYDAFTLRNLLQNLCELISHGNEPEIPSIRHAFSHYYGLVQESRSAGQAFWKQKADDFVFHKFPVMTPLHVENNDTLMVSRTCEASSSFIRQAASKAGTTMQAVLQAAWTRLLSAYTGETRVSFGVVLDGRATDLARRTTLPMITTLPVIADNIASNLELTQQMMQYNIELRRSQFIPMAQIQRSLGNTGALFDTVMIYQAFERTMGSPPLRAIKEHASVEYPIFLEVEESPSDTTKLNLGFRVSILPKDQAALLISQFEAILMDLLLSSEFSTSNLITSKPELFSILPASCESLPIDACLLHELVERSAQAMPSTVALEFVDDLTLFDNSRRWTYQEIDDLGNQVAHFIARQGIECGSIVATCFNKCPVAYFTLLGILKSGCAFLCLDPSGPGLRQTFILNDSNAAMLILNEQYDWVPDASLPVYTINEDVLGSFPTSPPLLGRPVLPSDSCYCLYTSGTTGTPKGCLISHENAVQAMAAFEYLFAGRWDPSSRWLQFAAFHFDVSILEQYWSWYVGITVVAAPKDVILSDLAATISKLRITHIDLTPSLARLISPEECPSLCKGVFITGGEKLRSDILEAWGSKGVIHNAYGPTEATIGITMYRGVPQNGRPSNIGNLFPNVGAYLFEPGSETPVLRGGVGELCVSGKLVGKGYLNREDLTRERFPVLDALGERIYRTGDLIRVLHDGSLDFLGRADDQVKLRGQRLEIGEINYVIRKGLADKASDVTTMVIKRKVQGIDLLVSFVASASHGGGPASGVQICYDAFHVELAGHAQEACKSRLATYMVPSFIIFLTRIPLSTNNKVDVNRLKDLFSDLSHEQLQALSPASLPSHRALNPDENKILEAICQITLTQQDGVIPTTTVFELGVDSITVTRLARRLRAMGFALATPSMILRHPQIGQLSEALGQPSFSASGGNALQITQSITAFRHRYLGLACEMLDVSKTEVEYIAPCTPLQEGMIARSKAQISQFAYFNQFHLRLTPTMSIDKLKAAFGRVIASYSILRTAFVDTTVGSIQVAIRSRPMRWFQFQANAESLDQEIIDRKRLWVDANRHVLKWPVEVDHGEVDGQHHILLRVFHGVYDARSLNLILDSLEAEYREISRPAGPAFISVLSEGPLLSHQGSHDFWKSLLKNHRFQPMPTLIEGRAATTPSTIHRYIKFENFEEKRKRLQVTHQTLLQAAWLYTLRQYFANPPTIGVILSGRSLPTDDIDLVVGPLFNTLPFRVDFTNDTSWVSLTQEIQRLNNDLLTFVHTPLRDIQKLCTNGQPIFDTLFTFDCEYRSTNDGGRTLFSVQDSPVQPDYPLAIEIIMIEDGTLSITLVAQGSIADTAALGSLLDLFSESLESLITSTGDTPLSLPAHPKTNKHALIPTSGSKSQTNNHIIGSESKFVWDRTSCDVRNELSTLTGVDRSEISEATNLFALGLDSIDMIKLAGRLTKLGYSVTIGRLMKQPTLASIATSLGIPRLPTIDKPSVTELDEIISRLNNWYRGACLGFSDVEAMLPPTPLQDSMVADMLRSDFHTYFNHDVVELPPDVEIDRLKVALSKVFASSPILRTAFVEVDDPHINAAYCQIIRKRDLEFLPPSKISSMNDISTVTDQARRRALDGKGASHLFQANFAFLGNTKLLVLSIAHALYDGWSLHMLHQDIEAAYESNYVPRQSYKSHLSRMIVPFDSSHRQFWADLLHGAPATLVPKPGTAPGPNRICRLEIPSKSTVAEIKALCRYLHVTPQVLGQACWAAVLASLTRSLDVVFGIVLSGRDTEEAQTLMFPTMNTVALRLTLHGTVAKFLEYCQDIMSGVLEVQHTPLRDIQRLSRSQGGRLFNTIFLLQNYSDNNSGSSHLLKSIHSVSDLDYPICAELELVGNDAIWRIAANEDYMSSRDVEKFGAGLESVLGYFSSNGDEQVLRFNSHDSQRVSICGLEPVPFHTGLQSCGSDVLTEHVSQPGIMSSKEYETIIDIFSELSRVKRHEIDPSLSIFHIGLDSISAIKASSMLRKRGLDISTRDLVTIPSILGILKKANQRTAESTEGSSGELLHINSTINGEAIRTLIQRAGLDPDSVEKLLPALPMQVHMLSVWQNSGGIKFLPKFTFKINSPIDLTTVSKAWVALVDENAMLRTHLISTASLDSPFLQIILNPGFANEHAMTVTVKRNSRWEFVYSATPFAAVHFLSEQHGEASLNLYIHHALYDGISLPIILNRFIELCTSALPVPAPIQSHIWYEFAMKHLNVSIRAQCESFWTSYLSETTVGCMPKLPQSLESAESQRISEFCSTPIRGIADLQLRGSMHGISIQALLFAAYAKSSMKRFRQNNRTYESVDYIFGVYLANRSGYPAIEEAPFPTLNIVPLKVKDPLSRSITTVAAEIQRDIAEISKFENSTVGLWEIQRWTGLRINTFVNILAAPDDLPLPGPDHVILEKLPDDDPSPTKNPHVSACLIAPDHRSLSPNMVKHSYLEAVDIELALRDEVLDLGIFGHSSILSATQAKEMATTILAEIEAL